MAEPNRHIKVGTYYMPISKEMAIVEGILPNDGSYIPPAPLTRREKRRNWRRTYLTVWYLRSWLSYHLDPDPNKDDE